MARCHSVFMVFVPTDVVNDLAHADHLTRPHRSGERTSGHPIVNGDDYLYGPMGSLVPCAVGIK